MIDRSLVRFLAVLVLAAAPVLVVTSTGNARVVQAKVTKFKLSRSGLQIRCKNIGGIYFETNGGGNGQCTSAKADIRCDYGSNAPDKNCTRTPARVKPPAKVFHQIMQDLAELATEGSSTSNCNVTGDGGDIDPGSTTTSEPPGTTSTTEPPATTSTTGPVFL